MTAEQTSSEGGEGLSEAIRAVTDLWDEPLDEVYDIPQIVNAVERILTDRLAAVQAEADERLASQHYADERAFRAYADRHGWCVDGGMTNQRCAVSVCDCGYEGQTWNTLRARAESAEAALAELMRATWVAYVESGADTDGDEKWHCTPEWAGKALVHAVETLRKDYDDSLDESDVVEAERDDLRGRLAAVKALHPRRSLPSHLAGLGAPDICDTCWDESRPGYAIWPCPTTAALANPSADQGEA